MPAHARRLPQKGNPSAGMIHIDDTGRCHGQRARGLTRHSFSDLRSRPPTGSEGPVVNLSMEDPVPAGLERGTPVRGSARRAA